MVIKLQNEGSVKGVLDLWPSLSEVDYLTNRLFSWIRKHSHPITFFTVVAVAILCHVGAISLTSYAIASGYGLESNSFFYSMGSSSFLIFGFLLMGCYFATIWFIRMPKALRLIFALSLTVVPIFDFAHDLIVSTYYRELFSLLIRFVG